jgi:hypothetical protein
MVLFQKTGLAFTFFHAAQVIPWNPEVFISISDQSLLSTPDIALTLNVFKVPGANQ